MGKYDLIIFDIDGTLTKSKQPMTQEMAGLLGKLLDKYQIAIISGAGFEQFKWQILDTLTCSDEALKKLHLLPVDGTVSCIFANGWQCEADAPLLEEEKERILKAFENIFEKAGLEEPQQTFGKQLKDRGAQLNFSALGHEAPLELKEKWDPATEKRQRIVEVLKVALPEFSFHIGGTTSIETTRVGIDKAYGINKLIAQTGIAKERILFVGDKLFHGGNDAPALSVGIVCQGVDGPKEGEKVIWELLGNG